MAGKFLTDLAHTRQGAKLMLTEEQKQQCRVVYRLLEEKPDTYIFDSLWNPDAEYSDNHVIVPLQSTYDGLSKEYPIGTCFANIENSSNDPKYPSGDSYNISWIGVIRRAYLGTEYKADSCCAERDTIYGYNDEPVDGFLCTNHGLPDSAKKIYLMGAHVLMEEKHSQTVPDGGSVFLLPLCDAHNRYDPCRSGWGTGYYMKLERPMKVVKLRGYMKDPEPGTLPAYP